jgi:hypothetical protein
MQIRIFVTVAFLVSAPTAQAQAQDANHDHKAQALEALGAITADIVELSRITDYQADLIELAQEDRQAASLARRERTSCARRDLVLALCSALPVSFPKTLIDGGRR